MKSPVRKPGSKLLAAGLLIGSALSQSAMAATVFVGVYAGNDADALSGGGVSGEIFLDKVDWIYDADGDPSNGNQLINPQTFGDLTISGTTFKDAPDNTEATAGTWSYTGPESVSYITVKFDSWSALYQITGGDTSGLWDLGWICQNVNNPDYCNSNGIAFGMSHVSAYSVVPVPAAVWLFGSGLLGLAGIARRKRNNI